MEKVTVGIINYNGMQTLPETLEAVQNLDIVPHEVLVVDNASTDGSREWGQTQFLHIRWICLDRNIGLPGARNVLLREAQTERVLIIDNDIVLEPNSLTQLMNAMDNYPRAGVCHPEIRDPYDPAAHHYNGGWIHYLCTLISRPAPQPGRERPEIETFDVVSGAALLMRKNLALEIGGFDGDYFFNWEDGDFTARVTLAGHQCLNVPGAVAHHRSKPRGTSKVFYQTRNRWYFMLKLYAWRTLFLIAPMLLVFEFSLAAFMLLKGSGRAYLQGNLAVIRDLPALLKKRQAFQPRKVKRDRDWLHAGEMYIPGALTQKGMARVQRFLFRLLNAYWKWIRPFCG